MLDVFTLGACFILRVKSKITRSLFCTCPFLKCVHSSLCLLCLCASFYNVISSTLSMHVRRRFSDQEEPCVLFRRYTTKIHSLARGSIKQLSSKKQRGLLSLVLFICLSVVLLTSYTCHGKHELAAEHEHMIPVQLVLKLLPRSVQLWLLTAV